MPSDARSKRPIFCGQRLTVFEWMLDDLIRMLGPHWEAFDIHDWLDQADGKASASPLICADWWPWLKAETVREAQRRGYQVLAVKQPGRFQSEWVPWTCPHQPPCAGRNACDVLVRIASVKAS